MKSQHWGMVQALHPCDSSRLVTPWTPTSKHKEFLPGFCQKRIGQRCHQFCFCSSIVVFVLLKYCTGDHGSLESLLNHLEILT